MNGEKYIDWKNWGDSKFGQINSGRTFYFEQVFKIKLKKSSVLEIGFGNGELMSYFRKNDHSVSGVEINNILVSRARKNGYKAFEGWVCDIDDLVYENFDLIVAFDVMEHLTYDQLNDFFSWINSHLNDNGRLYIRFPEGSSPLGLANQNGDFTHITSLTKSKIIALCEGSDLKLLSYSDDILSSNKLCSFFWGGGKIFLLFIQWYARAFKWLLKMIFYPLNGGNLNLSTNSIAVIVKKI
jgi:2-polyprenyl-3-methyl-5-hydroxy-6-metoxy-1,4-benzoquinol methylase